MEERSFWISAAAAYLDECRMRASSARASELALRTSRTPVQLAREFRAAVGVGVKDYLRRQQVDLAKELLRRPEITTARIAEEAGFGTVRTFYRVFREVTGISPTDYRKKLSLAGTEGRN